MKNELSSGLNALLQQGLAHHQAGRLAEAEGLYRQVLASAPQHPYANNYLGVLASQVGRHDVAADLLQQAVRADARVPEFHNNLGLALQSLGRPEEAEVSFRQAIRLNPKFPEAHNNLGTVLQERKRFEDAGKAFEQALRLRPNYAEAWFNAGNVNFLGGKYEVAAKRFEQAIKLKPNYAKAYCGLGQVQQRLGLMEKAEKAFQKALELQPDFAEAHGNYAALLRESGRLDEAEKASRRALELNPNKAESWNGLGELHQLLGRMGEAEAAFRRAIALKPDYPEAHNNLGVLLVENGLLEEALKSYRTALEIRPGFFYALNNIGIVYASMGRLQDAMDCYREALALDSSFAMAHTNMGNTYYELGQLDRARECYTQALVANPDEDVTLSNLGNVLLGEGKLEDAKIAHQRALSLNPTNAVAHSNLIFLMDFDAQATTESQQEERKKWNARYAAPLQQLWRAHANDRDPNRVLRVGYVSADFRMHSAAYTFEPMLCGYDRENFEVYCYSNSPRNDQMTEKLRNCVTGWRNIVGKSDADADAMIRADKIDILVDLAAHSAGNRLLLFARKPAPVQVTGWGHGHGTGLDAMDYLFGDPVSIPPDECHYFAEKIAYLPCLIPYACPDNSPPVAPLPAMKNGYVTFGCFSRLVKISESSLALWAEILLAMPEARLIVKAKELDDVTQRLRIADKMAECGVGAERLTLLGRTSWYEHMAAYGAVDIALDPFPHGGGIGTFEALWMGVPVVTLKGPSLPSRVTAAIETALGLEDWVADNREAYLVLARNKASNPRALAELRARLREQVKASPAGNPVTITGMVEQNYRKMWREWLTNKDVQK
ncbi:acetylglucosamine transferase [Sulfurimicrobium lacus]|uniref:protein O-GlcNAc transferase n=1 Tax=Sulfurimicrobium lacus TaxID=2715678 RepID=A0A6F8VC76_9PROT|nr:tetratricopeptide repeat protein [Sulfurimicrobium lacus]BCB26930.1 acetylglucosamine transferase [Sulfurimicrobium lacus]